MRPPFPLPIIAKRRWQTSQEAFKTRVPTQVDRSALNSRWKFTVSQSRTDVRSEPPYTLASAEITFTRYYSRAPFTLAPVKNGTSGERGSRTYDTRKARRIFARAFEIFAKTSTFGFVRLIAVFCYRARIWQRRFQPSRSYQEPSYTSAVLAKLRNGEVVNGSCFIIWFE